MQEGRNNDLAIVGQLTDRSASLFIDIVKLRRRLQLKLGLSFALLLSVCICISVPPFHSVSLPPPTSPLSPPLRPSLPPCPPPAPPYPSPPPGLLYLVLGRLRSSVAGLEQQLALSKEALSDKNDEIRRLKALARQLEGSRSVSFLFNFFFSSGWVDKNIKTFHGSARLGSARVRVNPSRLMMFENS